MTGRALGSRWASVLLAEAAGLDPDGGKYVVVCERHATLVNTDSKRDARAIAHDPASFCDACRGGRRGVLP